jgi:hypothetical protein
MFTGLIYVLLWTFLFLDNVDGDPYYIEHPRKRDLFNSLNNCRMNETYCLDKYEEITDLAIEIANDYTTLLLHDVGQADFQECYYYVHPKSQLGRKFNHILGVLAFSQGLLKEAEKYWDNFDNEKLSCRRTLAAQLLMKGNEEKRGLNEMNGYIHGLHDRIEDLFQNFTDEIFASQNTLFNHFMQLMAFIGDIVISVLPINSKTSTSSSNIWSVRPSLKVAIYDNTTKYATQSEFNMLELLLSEAQGQVGKLSRLADLSINAPEEQDEFTSMQRFRLAVGLAKLGLYDLSLRHVWLSATPWEAPLYLLRAKLVFSPIHQSIRSLALAVDNFETQGENILSTPMSLHQQELMVSVCNIPNEIALALQALPMLHLAGYSSPRHALSMGHSPVALSVLLSEIYMSVCPSHSLILPFSSTSSQKKTIHHIKHDNDKNSNNRKIQIGIVSGSFDGVPGKIILGFIESIRREKLNNEIELVAMCFPTPRDETTDRTGAVFDKHINLSSENKTQAVERILASAPDFIIFTDAALDSRVFTLAHERLAIWQGALWGWGGTLGIDTLDFYFIPEPLWLFTAKGKSGCPKRMTQSDLMSFYTDHDEMNLNNAEMGEYDDTNAFSPHNMDQPDSLDHVIVQPQQDLFKEQVVFLKGLPPLPSVTAVKRYELWSVMEHQYFMPYLNQSHLYLFPGSVRHMHPEFDQALYVLLKTDPQAVVLMAVPHTGRDKFPTIHAGVRHDLMHPTMPAAAAAKLRQRLRSTLGAELSTRIRILPPLEDRVYHSLRRQVIAVLDPFPVGVHVPILQAMKEGIPVVSAPVLQECTNSHAPGIAQALMLSRFHWPTSAESYAVEAIRLQREQSLRLEFVPPDSLRTSFIPRPSNNNNNNDNGHTTDMNLDRNRRRMSGVDISDEGVGYPEDIQRHQRDSSFQASSRMEMIEIVDELNDGTHGEQLVTFVTNLIASMED